MTALTNSPSAKDGQGDPSEDVEIDPIEVAIHLRARTTTGLDERFGSSDLPKTWDLARNPRIARILRDRRFQFALILPNQLVFWTVIFVGLFGTAIPGLNFGAAITWYIWFCLVFVLMVVVGRAWCAMCPFGGFAEWVQRGALFRRTQRALGLGRRFPEPLARLGFLLPVVSFLVLTWIEEFFNIAGPGNPAATSFMVIGIVVTALSFFLVFERRTFCRYVCPLTSLIGTVGAMGSVAGFRTRDRELCLGCTTKECMRGGENGFGCPWYTWPGSADSNLSCGLCSECFKACPHENIGLFVQRPLTSVVAPRRRRADVAWAIVILWGLVVYQQVNATSWYASIDNWLNTILHFPHYPDPVAYFGFIALFALLTTGMTWAASRLLARPGLVLDSKSSFLDRESRFRTYFLPIAYGLIPVVGADYFARQLPKFFKHSTRIVPAVEHIVGASSTHATLYSTRLLSDPWIVVMQLIVIGLGTVGALVSTWRISTRDLVGVSRNTCALRIATCGIVLIAGFVAAVFYVAIHAAS